MKAFHDSRQAAYRLPLGSLRPQETVCLQIDVEGVPGATVELRTWTEGAGEARYPMTPVPSDAKRQGEATRYQVEWTATQAGVVWYHFIITETGGATRRYGARDGSFGGEGQLRDWEPPSFPLAVCDDDEALLQSVFLQDDPLRQAPMAAAVAFLRNEITAPALVQALETLRESCPEAVFQRAFHLLESYRQTQLMALLGGASPQQAEHGGSASLGESQRGLAKGRLWCACLLQMLAVRTPRAQAPHCHAAPPEEAAPAPHDHDCEDIVANALDLHRTLPLFAEGTFSCFAVNDDVFGFWRQAEGESVCVLLNSSLQHAYDIPLPLAGEEVSDVLGGYEVPVMSREACSREGMNAPDAERYAVAHLYQLGSAVLYFHPAQRLAQPIPEGVGVLAHLTSLPGAPLGAEARRFVDTLARAGVRHWQVLPVNPTDEYGSPYAGISAFAGNVNLLDAQSLDTAPASTAAYRRFCQSQASWLEPYASFMAIRETVGEGIPWQAWPQRYRAFTPGIAQDDPQLREAAERWRQRQFAFDCQWRELRSYANERGIGIVGDMPLYVSADSADVWANPGIFQLEPDGTPSVVAGCPPDSFAEEGQVWGNPVYNWDALARSGYRWWLERLKRAFSLYDFVRLDHFIGFCRYYRIPAGQKAAAGHYQAGPGLALFQKAFGEFGPLPLIAEDLGMITPAVRALTAACGFAGMDIVQFADGGDPLQGYRPRPHKVVYTGTHDNQTLKGYAATRYPERDAGATAEKLANMVLECGRPVRILPLQDVLGLDNTARMNTPGTKEGNWAWQASPAQMEGLAEHLEALLR